jgi:hypothetical protein
VSGIDIWRFHWCAIIVLSCFSRTRHLTQVAKRMRTRAFVLSDQLFERDGQQPAKIRRTSPYICCHKPVVKMNINNTGLDLPRDRTMTLRYAQCLAGTILISISFAAHADEGPYTTLNYGADQHFQTSLYKAVLLGQLPATGKEPYLIFTGRSCIECDENTSVYIHSPSDGSMKGGGLDHRSAYPDNYYAYETGRLVSRVRMFIGRCIDPSREAVVWFVHEKLDNGSWLDRIFLTSVKGGKLDGMEATAPLPRIADAKAAVAKGVCREIPPIRKAYTEP